MYPVYLAPMPTEPTHWPFYGRPFKVGPRGLNDVIETHNQQLSVLRQGLIDRRDKLARHEEYCRVLRKDISEIATALTLCGAQETAP